MRLRLVSQRTAIWAQNWDAAYWIQTGKLRTPESQRPAEDDPAVKIAQEQIRKDGRVIPENIAKAVEEWRAKMSKPAEPT
jgi:hypothetical protein